MSRRYAKYLRRTRLILKGGRYQNEITAEKDAEGVTGGKLERDERCFTRLEKGPDWEGVSWRGFGQARYASQAFSWRARVGI